MPCLDKYPFLMNYFKNGAVAPCILFRGNDFEAQYEIALEIARILNCKKDAMPDCDCLNCKWIRQNTHPAVLTYSKTDNKPSDDDSKTMFSIAQARAIKNDLAITSEYHRVLIFCDRDKDGNPSGLNPTNFSTDAANALLKTFEEPPENTTFIFLTKDVTDMISTVVSRSQCFFVPSMKDEPRNYELVQDFLTDYIGRRDVLEFTDEMINLVKEHNPEAIFIQMQNYITELMKSNLDNRKLKHKLIKDIKSIEKAKKGYKLNMNLQTIMENMIFALLLD